MRWSLSAPAAAFALLFVSPPVASPQARAALVRAEIAAPSRALPPGHPPIEPARGLPAWHQAVVDSLGLPPGHPPLGPCPARRPAGPPVGDTPARESIPAARGGRGRGVWI